MGPCFRWGILCAQERCKVQKGLRKTYKTGPSLSFGQLLPRWRDRCTKPPGAQPSGPSSPVQILSLNCRAARSLWLSHYRPTYIVLWKTLFFLKMNYLQRLHYLERLYLEIYRYTRAHANEMQFITRLCNSPDWPHNLIWATNSLQFQFKRVKSLYSPLSTI